MDFAKKCFTDILHPQYAIGMSGGFYSYCPSNIHLHIIGSDLDYHSSVRMDFYAPALFKFSDVAGYISHSHSGFG